MHLQNLSNLPSQGTNVLSVDLGEIMVAVGGQSCVINTNLVTSNVSSHKQCIMRPSVLYPPPI